MCFSSLLTVIFSLAPALSLHAQGLLAPVAAADTLHKQAISAYIQQDFGRATRILTLQELPLRRAIGTATKISGCYYTIGLCYKATKSYTAALAAFQKTIDYTHDLDAYTEQGKIYNELGEYQKAINCFRKKIVVAHTTTNTTNNNNPPNETIASAAIDLSNAYTNIARYDSALTVAQYGLTQTKDTLNAAKLHLNAGNSFLWQHQYNQALTEYNAVIQLLRTHQTSATNELALAYLNSSIIYKRQTAYTTAFSFVQKAFATNKQLKDTALHACILDNTGDIYTAQHDFPKALQYYEQAET